MDDIATLASHYPISGDSLFATLAGNFIIGFIANHCQRSLEEFILQVDEIQEIELPQEGWIPFQK